MLLALDVGNTNITAGVFAGKRIISSWRIVTDPGDNARHLGRQFRRHGGKAVKGVVYGSVVPRLDRTIEAASRAAFGCRAIGVTPRSPLGMRLKVRTPGQVGADRILNALAAFERARGAAVVIDFGTATTFDCVSSKGDYLGGAILPGPHMAARALHEGTAKLPLVAVRRPKRVVGKDTVECIQAGLYYGYLGMIEKVLRLTVEELRHEGHGPRIAVLATGGLSVLFHDDLPSGTIFCPNLTLEGLRIAHARLTRGEATV